MTADRPATEPQYRPRRERDEAAEAAQGAAVSAGADRPQKRRVRRLHEMRAKWGDCYWKPSDDEHYPGEHRCEELEPDLIEFENDVRADFTELIRAVSAGADPEPRLDWHKAIGEWVHDHSIYTKDRPDTIEVQALYAFLDELVSEGAAPRAEGLDELRVRVREKYNWMPDDSHGDGYRNSGIESVLHIIEEMAGRDFEGMCEPSADQSTRREAWCLTHGGPMPQRGPLWCRFALRPWEWREEAIAKRQTARPSDERVPEEER